MAGTRWPPIRRGFATDCLLRSVPLRHYDAAPRRDALFFKGFDPDLAMLQKLRSSTASIVAKALFVLLILSFAAWGIQGYIFQAQQGDAIATVGDAKITGPELAVAFRRDLRRYQQAGINITAEQAREMGVLNQALDRLVAGRLYNEAGSWLGMAVSDGTVSAQIRQEPAFFDENQIFSRARFQVVLSQAEYSEAQFVADMRRDILRRQILNSLDVGVDAPLSLATPLNSWRGEKRIATLAKVDIDESLDVGEPDEETVRKLHEELAGRFTAPERRVVSFVHISPDVAVGNVTVTEDELREEYESRIDEFREPRKRIIEQIQLADQPAASQADGALAAGRSFEDVAREFGSGGGADLEFGRFEDGGFPIPDVADVIEALDVGGVSEPIETAFGWHIFRLAGFQEERTQPFEEVRDTIETGLKNERVGDVIYDLSTAIQDGIAGGASLELAAESSGLEVRKAGPFDIRGLDESGARVDGIPESGFLESAFAASSGMTGQIAETADGGYFILRVDEVIPSALRPLDEVRDDVISAWKTERRKSAAQERALDIVQKVENGADLAAIAEAEGLSVSESDPFDRRGQGVEPQVVSPALVSDLFRVKVGQAAMTESGTGYTVAQLKEILSAESADAEELAEILGDALTSDVLVQFNNALRDRFGVQVDESALARLF